MGNYLITGGSSGIGRELALQLIAKGHQVFVQGRSEEKLAEFSGQVPTLALDLTTAGAAEKLVETAEAQIGPLDGVAHCAGVGLIKPALETSDAEFTRIMNINTRATFLTLQSACRRMAERKKGLFLTIPGILGKAPMKNASAYIASKYAVTGLVKAFAQELQRSGVRFCLFHFGGVDSPFWNDLNMAVQRDKMIPVAVAAQLMCQAIEAPPHLVLSEVIMQPESHQLL